MPMTYDATVIANPNVLHYYELSETTGDVAHDAIDVLNGSLVGGVTLNQSGFVDQDACMLFDGVDGEITFDSAFVNDAEWTMDCWFYLIGTTGSIIKVSDGNELYLGSPLGGGAAGLYMNYAVGVPGLAYAGDVNTGVWYYGIIGWDGAASVCINVYFPHAGGGTGGSGAVSGTSIIGHGSHGYFHGYIQKVGTYSNGGTCVENQTTLTGCPAVPCAGGTLGVTVTPSAGNVPIPYSTNVDWITLSGPVAGPGAVIITVASNAGGSTRTGFVTIGNSVFSVQQVCP